MLAKVININNDSYPYDFKKFLNTIIDVAANTGPNRVIYPYVSYLDGAVQFWMSSSLNLNVTNNPNVPTPPTFVPTPPPPPVHQITKAEVRRALLDALDKEYKEIAYNKVGRYAKDLHRFTFRSRGKILITAQINGLSNWHDFDLFTTACLGKTLRVWLTDNNITGTLSGF